MQQVVAGDNIVPTIDMDAATGQKSGVGRLSDKDKNPGRMQNLSCAILPVLNGYALQLSLVSIEPYHLGLEADVNLRMALNLFPDHLGGFQFLPANQQRHPLRKLEQEKALFGRAVSAAHNHDGHPLVKGGIAGGAEVDAGPDVTLFAGGPSRR